ncbi:AAA family ATPase [Candidatus Peregrinibacteria bacterium]|nr:AAA family ATPase [Candidatus Peregrinibacteria bacterium]
MIYLIGGPPKCGKTMLAKKLSKKLGIQWVASDTLQVVAREYVSKYASREEMNKLYPHNAQKGKTNDETYSLNTPKQIANNYIKQAKSSYNAIDMLSICEITDGNDYIVEGYHVTPQLAARLIKKYGRKHFHVLFLSKTDIEKMVRDFEKSSTPNDWILCKTKEKGTLYKIAEMISYYGQFFDKEAKKYGFKILNMDNDFGGQLKKAIELLTK